MRWRSLFIAVPVSGLAAASPLAAQPSDHVATLRRLAGCYQLTLGPWSRPGLAPAVAAAQTPPARFRLDTVAVSRPSAGGYAVEPMELLEGQGFRGRPAKWSPVGRDSVAIAWSTGFVGVALRLAVRGESLIGRARVFDDVQMAGEPPDPEASVTAIRVRCESALRGAEAISPRFEAVQPELFSLGGSFTNAWADHDGDGDLDLFVGFNGAANRLYRNDRGVFTDVASAAGIADGRATRAAAWGDYDADGDPDLLVGFAPGATSVLKLYRNDRRRFTDVTADVGLTRDSGAVRQPAWIDVDGDGDLDLFVAFRDRANAFFRNERGHFRDVASEIGLADRRRTVGAVWFDSDEDGDLDLYVGNMDGDANGLFRNDGGRFTDIAAEAGLAWAGRLPNDAANGTVRPCAADVDGDGQIDLFAANYGKNGFFLNRGGGRFEDASSAWGIDIDARYDACAFADFDNDGRLDLYVNGTVTGGVSYRDYLFRNTGQRLDDVTPDNVRTLQADHGVQWADFDADGDMDLALTGARPDGMHSLLRNMLSSTNTSRSLHVRVLDSRGRATRAGAEVRLFAAGTTRLLGTRLVDSGSGYDAQSDMPVHFGLPTSGRVDVEVTWPSGGRRTTTRVRRVNPGRWTGRVLEVRAP